MKKLNISLLLVLGLLLGFSALSAQNNYRVSGKVYTTTGHSMPNVEVSLVGDTQTWLDTTEVDGSYAFLEIPKNQDYHLEFKKELGNVANGISAEDAKLLSNHLMGLGKISTYGLWGGDLDESSTLTTLDVVAILRLVVYGYVDPFNHKWQFIYAYANVNEINPFFPEPTLPLRINTYQIFKLNQDMDNIDFVGSKVGDINLNADPFE